MSTAMELMFEEIKAQGQLFLSGREKLTAQCREILDSIDVNGINKIFIAGCGDSFYCGVNARDLFLKYTGIHTEAWQALEFSRYVCPYEVDEHSLVICISNSGKVSRTIESAMCAGKKNAVVVAYTGNREGPLAKACRYHVITEVPKFNRDYVLPGTYTYTASMMSLVCMAISLGQRRGYITEEQEKDAYDYLCELEKAIVPTVEADDRIIEKYMAAYVSPAVPEPVKLFHFLGAGPNWGTAQYAAEKMLESAAFDAVCQGTEEWAHTQYFTTRRTTHTVILAPRGRSRDRAMEITEAITVMDGKKIIIGEDADAELRRKADIFIPICGAKNIREEFSPLLYMIPIGLFSMHLSRVLNAQAFSFDRPWVQEENLRQIWESRISTDM